MERQDLEQDNPREEEFQEILKKDEKIFHDLPMQLPSKRKIEHIIEVKPNSTSINIKPYCYLCHHKTNIERPFQYMLKCGIIKTSRCPYLATIVLVQKNNGLFKLCIYYQGLKKLIIKNKFPIPFIDEMLDEIHGEKYFQN